MFDTPIHYIVLSRRDYAFDMDWFARYNAVLDEIEAKMGPGIMIAISKGYNVFSSGFNLEYWLKKSKLIYNKLHAMLDVGMNA